MRGSVCSRFATITLMDGRPQEAISGSWGRPVRVAAWGFVFTWLQLYCRYAEVGAFPGYGYTLGTQTILLIGVLGALHCGCVVPRLSFLLQLPVSYLAIAVYLTYQPTGDNSHAKIFAMAIAFSMLPRVAIGSSVHLAGRAWPDAIRMMAGIALYHLWDALTASLAQCALVYPRWVGWHEFLGMTCGILALIPPKRWLAMPATSGAPYRRASPEVSEDPLDWPAKVVLPPHIR